MTRLMGDATHAGVPQLAAVRGLQLVAGYVTGTPDIRWTGTDWMQFPGAGLVTIDQGANGSPVPDAIVRDVETGAWSPASAVIVKPWTAVRPTIYCARNSIPDVLAAGWRGDLWLAIPQWLPGDPLPATSGCTVVAVQNDFSNPAYDLSVVLDPYWPQLPLGETMLSVIQLTTTTTAAAPVGADGQVYITSQSAAGAPWLKAGPIGGPVPLPGKIDAVLSLAASVPTVFISCTDPVAAGDGDVYISQLAAGVWSAWVKIT